MYYLLLQTYIDVVYFLHDLVSESLVLFERLLDLEKRPAIRINTRFVGNFGHTSAKKASSRRTRTPVAAKAFDTSRQALWAATVAADSVKPGV